MIFYFYVSEMSKKVIEFSVGDPKTNQQTASKLDCQIIVNNSNGLGGETPRPKLTKSTKTASNRDVSINDDVQVFKSTDESAEDELHSISEEPKSLKVTVPVNRQLEDLPSSTSRFYVTSRNPAVLREEILQSIPVKDELIRILTEMVTHRDGELIANILDRRGKIILNAEDLASLIALVLSSSGQEVSKSDIKIDYRDEYITSCLKLRVSPFKSVNYITVGEQDLKIHQFEAYNVITNVFNISADIVYFPLKE